MSTSGLAAAILDLSLPVGSDSIVDITVRLMDLKNIGLAVGIALLSHHVFKWRYEYIRIGGRHLGFITSGYVGQ